jgi:predicted adenylyl cyclase CyaB
MPRNIEIKARVDSPPLLRARAAALATDGPKEIAQDDTFFACDHGRLKLRAFADGSGELIFYRRADLSGPKASFYVLTRTQDPDGLREALTLAYGQAGRVIKQRTLFLVGRTRIHLDRVEGLGDFVELEVVLADGDSAEDGAREATALMARLGIDETQLADGAYVDLLARGGPAG